MGEPSERAMNIWLDGLRAYCTASNSKTDAPGRKAAAIIIDQTLEAERKARDAEMADLRAANASLKADCTLVDRMRDRLADLEQFEDGGITSVMHDELYALRRWLGGKS